MYPVQEGGLYEMRTTAGQTMRKKTGTSALQPQEAEFCQKLEWAWKDAPSLVKTPSKNIAHELISAF